MASTQKDLTPRKSAKHISKEKLKKYIRKYLDKGYAPKYLKTFLLEQGYEREFVDRAYFELGLKVGDAGTEILAKVEEKYGEVKSGILSQPFLANLSQKLSKLPRWVHVLIGVIIVLSIIGVLYPIEDEAQSQGSTLTFAVKDCADDKSCFIAEAKKCNDAVYLQGLEGSVIEFSSSKSSESFGKTPDNCVIKKRFKSFSAAEPKEIQELFKDLEMECTYTKDDFDSALANDLVSNIEKCDGLLKDAIYELRIAQLELEAQK